MEKPTKNAVTFGNSRAREPIVNHAGYRRLCAAVLLQAVKDAQDRGFGMEPGDRLDALRWLRRHGAQWAAWLDLDVSAARWIDTLSTGGGT